RDPVERGRRMGACGGPDDAKRVARGLDLAEVAAQLLGGGVEPAMNVSGELHLEPRFERDPRPIANQLDRDPVLALRRPAELEAEGVEDRRHRDRSIERERVAESRGAGARSCDDAEALVFEADPELARGLEAALEVSAEAGLLENRSPSLRHDPSRGTRKWELSDGGLHRVKTVGERERPVR